MSFMRRFLQDIGRASANALRWCITAFGVFLLAGLARACLVPPSPVGNPHLLAMVVSYVSGVTQLVAAVVCVGLLSLTMYRHWS